MKRIACLLILIIFFISVPVILAQDATHERIAHLQDVIARREKIDQYENLPAQARAINRNELEKARMELQRALASLLAKENQAQIADLQKYLDTLGDSVTVEERQKVGAELSRLRGDISERNRVGANSLPPNTSNSTHFRAAARPDLTPVPANYESVSGPRNAPLNGSAKSNPTFEIISPLHDYSTELKEIELFVGRENAAPLNVPLAWSVKNNGKVFVTGTLTIREGVGSEKIPIPLRSGENEIIVSDFYDPLIRKGVTVTRGERSVVAKNARFSAGNPQDDAAPDAATVEATMEHSKTPFTRGIVGLEQAAAASANPEQKLFLEFNLTAPIFRKGRLPLDAPLWLWLNPRITSLPQPVSGSIADFATSSGFTTPFTTGKVNEIVQGFEFLGGVEIPIKLNNKRVTGPIDSGFGPGTKVRFGLSLIVGAGMSTPFSTQKSLQVFKVNQTVIDRFPSAQGKEFIAFISPDRNRFFRQYYGGIRLKSYYVKHSTDDDPLPDGVLEDEALDTIFPGLIDITFGQNEALTGGKLQGGIVRIEGIYPLPFIKGDKRGSVYVFGSAMMKLRHAKTELPIILQLADPVPQVPGTNVLLQQLPTRDADHYRLGVGVDLIRLLKRDN